MGYDPGEQMIQKQVGYDAPNKSSLENYPSRSQVIEVKKDQLVIEQPTKVDKFYLFAREYLPVDLLGYALFFGLMLIPLLVIIGIKKTPFGGAVIDFIGGIFKKDKK